MNVTREQTQAKLDKQAAGVMRHTPEQDYTVADRFEDWARSTPERTLLIYRDQTFSYDEVNRQANRYASIALNHGIQPGDIAAVMIENRAEFFYAWLGLAKIGAISTLINTSASHKALHHALTMTKSKLLFLGDECRENFATLGTDTAMKKSPDQLTVISVAGGEDNTYGNSNSNSNGNVNSIPISSLLADASDQNPTSALRAEVIGETPLFYVFTSGTTGLPKAAIISHMRWLGIGDGWKDLLNITADDVFYCILPLFHGAAGMSLTSNALAAGASIVIKRKFSASRFWQDINQYGVTTTQYIGEICRYLVNQPLQENEKQHCLLRMTGAGLTTDVWRQFKARFGDLQILEGWGATEANCGLMNVDNKIGSCGRIPFKDRSNIRLVKYDLASGSHVTDAEGYMVECEPGEAGEIIAMILDIPGVGAGRFEGYTDQEATEKKILRNVFSQGDAWFKSGDLFTQDEDGYFFFVDRLGDTYRWKSENVSTTEVVEALSSYPQAELINVYGVQVPDHEGRAGMAAIQLRKGAEFDPKALYNLARETLPAYAIPLFIRMSGQADITQTFKLRKVDLQKQGYDPARFDDPLYVLDHQSQSYSPYSEVLLSNLGVLPFTDQQS